MQKINRVREIPLFDDRDSHNFDKNNSKRKIVKFQSVRKNYQQVQKDLQESKKRFHLAFKNAVKGMTMVSPEGRFLQVNRSLCEIVGYSEAKLLATDFQSITHPDDLDADLNYVRQLLAGEIRTYQMEKRYIHKYGHIVWIWLSVSLVRDRQGQPLYFISQIQDISDRKQLEAILLSLLQIKKRH